MHQRPVEILLVDDSPADARLTRTALMEGAVPKKIHVVTDGAQAIDFLRRRNVFHSVPRPDVVLLDLNLPKRDGLEVLRDIKTDPELHSITVIILTTSQLPEDVRAAYELSANCYVVKPVDLDQFYRVMRGIEEFWMTLATLPTISRDPNSGTARDDSARSEEPGNGRKGSAGARHRTAATIQGRTRRLVNLLVRKATNSR